MNEFQPVPRKRDPIVPKSAKKSVRQFSQIRDADLPEELQGLRNYMTDNQNQNEEKELIDSLLVQLELLEREKEALRQRVPEDAGALSVIRSCGREQSVISDLRERLKVVESDRFELRKQQEIQNEIINSCQVLGADVDGEPSLVEDPFFSDSIRAEDGAIQ
jgi:hypothetical protein